MKKLMKLMALGCIALLLCVGIVLTAIATDDEEVYTGSIDELCELIDSAEEAEGVACDKAIADIADYLSKTPVDPDAEGYAEAMSDVYAIVIERAGTYVDVSGSTSVADEKKTQLASAVALTSLFDIPEDAEGYAEYIASYAPEALACAKAYMQGVGGAVGTAARGVAINRVSAVVKAHPLMERADGYEEFKAAYDAAVEGQADDMAALLEEFNSSVTLAEFEYGILTDQSYDDYENVIDPDELFGFTQKLNVNDRNTISVEEDESGNGYLFFNYYQALHTYIRTDLPKYDYGTVIEFDITTFGHLPEFGVEIGSSSSTDAGGTRYYPGYGGISSDGTFTAKASLTNKHTGQSMGSKVMENMIVPGEWTRISLVFDPVTGLLDYYVNYEYKGSGDATAGHAGTHNMHCFRIGSTAPENKDEIDDPEYDGDFAIDNFRVYQGTSVRSVDMLSSMTEDERFIYYTNYLWNKTEDISGLKLAYDNATALLEKYWDTAAGELDEEGNPTGDFTDYILNMEDTELKEKLMAGVGIPDEDGDDVNTGSGYFGFDYTPIYDTYIKANLEEFLNLVDALAAIERSVASIPNRQTAYNVALNYAVDMKNDIYMDDGRFDGGQTRLSDLLGQINADIKIKTYINYVNRFYLAFTANAMQSHYNTVIGVWQELSLADRGLLEDENFADFKKAYDRFQEADEVLAAALLEQNAKRIVECVAFIRDYDTLEEWQDPANEAYINKYILLIRDLVKPDDNGNAKYDEDYEGIDEALEFFAGINGYFYDILQKEHIAVIRAQLDKFIATDSYIEKMGICAYLNNYLVDDKNDIDLTREDISILLTELAIYESELEARREDYVDLLRQNTIFFKNTVDMMLSATDYSTKKSLYDQATIYYYGMNVGDLDIAEQLAAFDRATVELAEIERRSELFIESVGLYHFAVTEDEKFEALAISYGYSREAAEDYEGVAEAMDEFNSLFDAYMDGVNATNEEVAAAANAVIAVRANTNVYSVVAAIVNSLFGIFS